VIDGATTRKILISDIVASGNATAATLTNKSVDGANNTLTNLPAGSLSGQVPIASGGTGSSTASAARTALGVAVGTDVQAYDADLAALAANTTNGLWARTGAGTGAARIILPPPAGITIVNGDGVGGHPTVGLANDLGAIEALASTGIARRTAPDTWSVGTAVSNAELASVGAATLKGNPTGSTGAVADFTIQGLTARGAPDAANDKMLLFDNSSGTLKYVTPGQVASAGVAGVASLNGQAGALALAITPQGRATLTSGTPVMGSSVAGASTIYYTPYVGNQVPIYDGTNMVPTTFTELSQALSDTTKSPSAAVASRNYDLFVWNDGGTIRCTRGPDWAAGAVAGSNAVGSGARGSGAGSTQLIWVNGLPLNQNAITNGPAAQRGTYVGTVRTNASGTVDFIFGGAASGGLAGVFNVSNPFNQTGVACTVIDTGANYPYTAATTRQARASATYQVSYLVGLAGEPLSASYSDETTVLATAFAVTRIGVGFDSTTAFNSIFSNQTSTANARSSVGPAPAVIIPTIGAHYVAALEQSDGTNANIFNNPGASSIDGLIFQFRM